MEPIQPEMVPGAPAVPTPEEAERKAEALVTKYTRELQAALKREKDFRKDGWRFTKMYEAEQKDQNQFNILFSNTETLVPALYNNTPRPVVQRKFKDEDPLGAAAAKAGQRILEHLVDDGMSEYATFDELMKAAVLEAAVPGRGVTRFKYDAKFEKLENVQAAEAAEAAEGEGAGDDEEIAEPPPPEAEEQVAYEAVCGEEVPWDRVTFGYAKKWKDVPWVCFDHFMTEEDLEENFGAIANEVDCAEVSSNLDDEDQRQKADDMEGVKGCWVHEFWDRRDRTVTFFTTNFPRAPLKHIGDPLTLSGFFPMPRPFQLVAKISSMTPVALYKLYEEQAKELNKISARIVALIDMCKVRGMYDATVQGIEKVLGADEGDLIPAENVNALQQGQTLEKSLWLVPIEKVIQVLQQLYAERQQCKQVIFEIIGLADIMRGSSQASETLGAQELKNQWGGLRLKRHQKEISRYARDSLRIMLEIAVTKLSEETLKAMTGLPYPTGMEKAQQKAQLAEAQRLGQQIPPQIQEAINMPSWTEILGVLRSDLTRSYRIDIETNSTVDLEATDDKQQISDLLTAISQYLAGVGPLVQQGVMPFELVRDMLLAIVRRFRFGPELEEQLKKMQPPPPQGEAEAKAKQKEQAAKIAELNANAQAAQQTHDMDMQARQMELDAKRAEQERADRLAAMDMQYKEREHAMRMEALDRKAVVDAAAADAKLKQIAAQAVAAAAKPTPSKPSGGNSGGVRKS